MPASITSYLQSSTTKKYGDHYWIKYLSPLTGKMKRIPKKLTGPLLTREDAEAWQAMHLERVLSQELELLKRSEWRSAVEVVKLFNSYSAWKKKAAPRSAAQELSMVKNFVLPYFVTELGLKNPNEWWRHGLPFKSWLLEGARTEKDLPLTVSSANKCINGFNKFTEWLRDYNHITWENFRPVPSFEQSMQNRRGVEDLVDEKEFSLVSAKVKSLTKEMLIVQYWTGLRVGELLGLALNSLSNKIPDELREPFERSGFTVYVVILLHSQPRDPYITRGEGGEISRAPLKWRKEISPRDSRTIPITDKEAWNILAIRWKNQKVLFDKQAFGIKRENYLLFDGAQRNTYLRELRETYEQLGLRFKGSHVLRHTRATEFTLKGIPEKMQELVLGHKGLAQQRYIHIVELLNKRAREEAEEIEVAV